MHSNEEDADTTLGFKAAHTDVTKGELHLADIRCLQCR